MLNLQEQSIRWAVANIEKYSDTYLFPKPFEFDAILSDVDEVVAHLRDMDVMSVGIRNYRSILSPKSVKGFRIATQLDPIDSIISLAILYEISEDIEAARMQVSPPVSFSFRLRPEQDGTLYDESFNWNAFINRAQEFLEAEGISYVLVTDIADFYPSIYLHDTETVLNEAVRRSGKSEHATVLLNYLRAMHLSQTHKGLPIGPQFSRPIAELLLDELDRTLTGQGMNIIRYVDDIFVFAESESGAYKALSSIAQALYDRRNLKLNEQKTEILEIAEFRSRYLITPSEKETSSIIRSFNKLLDELGIERDPYKELQIKNLDPNDLERLRSVNLKSLLEAELARPQPDGHVITFVLGNLARFDNTGIADILLAPEYIRKLFPKLKSIVNYLERVQSFSEDQKKDIGEKIIALINTPIINTLAFNRMWLLSLFAKSADWDNIDEINALFDRYTDEISRRKLLLARGRANDIEYFRQHKNRSLDTNDWERRAFIAAISCLPKSERKPWFKSRSLRSRDMLDEIVEKWALNNHF